MVDVDLGWYRDAVLDLGCHVLGDIRPVVHAGSTNSRPYHLQTNDKPERFHKNIDDEIWCHETVSSYVRHYGKRDCAVHLTQTGRRFRCRRSDAVRPPMQTGNMA